MKQTEIKLNTIVDLKQSLMASLFSDMPQLQSIQLSWNYNRSKVGLYKINGQVFPYNEAELKDLAMSLEIDKPSSDFMSWLVELNLKFS